MPMYKHATIYVSWHEYFTSVREAHCRQKVTLFRVVLLVLVLSIIPAGFAVFLVEVR